MYDIKHLDTIELQIYPSLGQAGRLLRPSAFSPSSEMDLPWFASTPVLFLGVNDQRDTCDLMNRGGFGCGGGGAEARAEDIRRREKEE